MSSLNLSDDHLQTLAASAITAAMGPEERQALITDALRSMMEKSSAHSYGRSGPSSPLHDAFRKAMMGKAAEIAKKVIDEDPEVCERIEDMVREAATRVTVRDREETVNRLSSAMVDAFFELRDR